MKKDISKFLLLILGINVLIIVSALWIEYFLNIKPCVLCLYQRWIYYLATFLIIIFFLFRMKRKEIFIVLIILSLINFGVSGYHFGIEQGFFEETSSCKIENTGNIDKNQLLREMEKKNVVSCKDINFTILGLSLASINLIISLLLSLVYFKIYLWTKKIS